MGELQQRVWACIEDIKRKHSGSVLVVSHNLAILVLLCKVLGLDISSFHKLKQDVAAISEIELTEEGSRLLRLNDVCHLR